MRKRLGLNTQDHFVLKEKQKRKGLIEQIQEADEEAPYRRVSFEEFAKIVYELLGKKKDERINSTRE